MNVDAFKRTPLHYVAVDIPKGEQREEVKKLIAEGYDPNQKDRNGWVPLHFAAQERSAEAASALLEAGAHVDEADGDGNTPLWRAAFASQGDGSVIRVLLEAGADPRKANHRGVSPMELASRIANYDLKAFFE